MRPASRTAMQPTLQTTPRPVPRSVWTTSRILLAAAILSAAMTPLGHAQSEFFRGDVAPEPAPDQAPNALRGVGFDQRMGETVPADLPFVDAQGRPVELGDFFGKRPLVLALVYFNCPMLCPMTLSGLGASFKAVPFDIGEGYDVLVVSFNPEEGPEEASKARLQAIHRYGRTGTDAGWHFLTGKQDSITRLTEAVGFRYTYDEERGEYAHATGVVVLTPEGKIARYFFGIDFPAKDLKLGLVEAGNGKIGSAVDHLLLACCHYDPSTGEYKWSGWVVLLLRLGGVATLVALGSFILLMVRKERRARRDQPEAVAGHPGTGHPPVRTA